MGVIKTEIMIIMNGNFPRVFSKNDITLHSFITLFCSELITEIDSGIRAHKNQTTLSWCHLMASIVSQTFPVRLVDGYWSGEFLHSWVETKSGHIIDVSPIDCRSLPIMFPGVLLRNKTCSWKRVFREAKSKKDKVIFIKIRQSNKYVTAYETAVEQTKEICSRYTKMYKKHHEK